MGESDESGPFRSTLSPDLVAEAGVLAWERCMG